MSGVVAFEGELNAIVREYLDFNEFHETLEVFDRECADKGKAISPQANRAIGNQEIIKIQEDLLNNFDKGFREKFFHSWKLYVPKKLQKDDPTAQKLEFYLHMYFAVYGIKQHKSTENMTYFQQYLGSEGAAVSSSTEFLPFFALPFAPNPQQHPKFKDLFEGRWMSELRMRLQNFLSVTVQDQPQPRLFELYHGGSQSRQLDLYKQRTLEIQKQYANLMKKTNQLQNNYKSLVMIAADLVDTLEHSIQGGEVSEQVVATLAQRLVGNATYSTQPVDLQRPGTAGELLRDSVRPTSRHPQNKMLDYTRIKTDLTSMSNVRLTALLLQALRWELTRVGVDERERQVQEYIQSDILGCSHPSQYREKVLKLLTSRDTLIHESFARLLNAFASMKLGRNYLTNNTELVKSMTECLRQSEQDTPARQNIIGCAQKLSLRRHPQTVMIDNNLLSWLVEVLKDQEALSDYSLEYCVALLMNLCLRTQGKKSCIPMKGQILKVLANLLGHENQEIYPYVNGSLYSILAVPQIREEARALGMEEMVKCCKRGDQPDINKQLDYIIKQINSEDPMVEESDDEDDEDAEEDTLDAEIDEHDQLVAARDGTELVGSRLLHTYFTPGSARRKKQDEEELWKRPVTPAHVRTDVTPTRPTSNRAINNRPPTRSGSNAPSRASSHRDPAMQPSKKLVEAKGKQLDNQEVVEYQTAFQTKPKIPRTPAARPSSQGSVGNGPTPKPEFSESLPVSRPGSGGRPASNGGRKATPVTPNARAK